MITGYALLAIGGVLLAIGGFQFSYWYLLPGLFAYGAGLAVVLTVNDPVSISDATSPPQPKAKPPASPPRQNNSAAHWASLCSI